MNTSTSQQIKSKKRVADHGEVFTAEREVKAMCDLVKDETERLDSRFLEPACGDGNFLVEILSRKLAVLKKKYKKSYEEYEKFSVVAVGSIYGVELLQDNAERCRERLFSIWDKEYTKVCKNNCTDEFRNVIKYLFKKNILCGNALSLKQVDENQKDTETPIIFSEWSLVTGNKIKRRDFRLDHLLDRKNNTPEIFENDLEYDSNTQTFIPKPIKEFPLIDFRRINQYE